VELLFSYFYFGENASLEARIIEHNSFVMVPIITEIVKACSFWLRDESLREYEKDNPFSPAARHKKLSALPAALYNNIMYKFHFLRKTHDAETRSLRRVSSKESGRACNSLTFLAALKLIKSGFLIWRIKSALTYKVNAPHLTIG